MKIAVDISGALGPPSGVRRYAERLLHGLADVDADNQYIVYAAFWTGYPERLRQFRVPQKPNFISCPFRLPQRWLLFAEQKLNIAVLERLLSRHRPDVVHGVANFVPRLRRIPSVVTLHHVGGLKETSAWEDLYFRELTSRSVRQAARVIAVSESTRSEAIRQFHVAPEKIKTILEGGASPDFQDPKDPRLLERLNLAQPYILFVSALNYRKNLLCLLEAFYLLRQTGGRHLLVLAGQKEDAYKGLVRESRRLGLSEAVIFLEGLDEPTLNSLYRGADLFVYPSSLEGFGLPVLEAMACGIPVIVAKKASLPEIAGDAALYFDGQDAKELARQMERVLSDRQVRQDLVQKGLARAKMFDWRETARQTLEVYGAAAAGSAGA